MDPITSQLTANPIAMANPTGGMQQMPVGPVPGGQVPVGHMDDMNRMAPPMPPRGPMNMQGALTQFQQSPMYQNNPMLQQMMTQMQQNPMFQRFMNPQPMQPGMGNPFSRFFPNMPQFGQPFQPRPPMPPFPNGPQNFRGGYDQGRNYEREDQYGNPVARPVMYDYGNRMPELMQRYGMM